MGIFRMKKSWCGLLVLGGSSLALLALAGFQGKKPSNVMEAEQLTIRRPGGKEMIQLGFDKDVPYIAFFTAEAKTILRLEGGLAPALLLHNAEEKAAVKISAVDGHGMLSLNDPSGESRLLLQGSKNPDVSLIGANNQLLASLEAPGDGSYAQFTFGDANAPRLHLQGGASPGIFLRNEKSKTVGSWTVLSDGGGGFGLADSQGSAATILRGGSSPSVSFFSPQNEPIAAMGVIQKVPHLLISGPVGNEGILLHGGSPSSLVFVDEVGKVKILISKHGIFQGKEEPKEGAKKKENKVFSFDDGSLLFPSIEEKGSPN